MADNATGVTDQATPASGVTAVHTYSYTKSAVVYDDQVVVPESNRLPTFRGFVASFRTIGTAASPHNLFSIENAAGSTVLVAIRHLELAKDATAASTAVASQIFVSRPSALPTGGTAATKIASDSSLSSSASVVVRHASSADGDGRCG